MKAILSRNLSCWLESLLNTIIWLSSLYNNCWNGITVLYCMMLLVSYRKLYDNFSNLLPTKFSTSGSSICNFHNLWEVHEAQMQKVALLYRQNLSSTSNSNKGNYMSADDDMVLDMIKHHWCPEKKNRTGHIWIFVSCCVIECVVLIFFHS